MNYKKLYDQIIENAKNRNIIENKYYEEHHIIPKCLNGTNDDNNLVKLTLREHYVCHKLLAEIYKEFLIINKGFTNSEYNSDILIPDSIAIEKAEEYKKIIDTAIEEGNLSKLKDSLSIILK